MGQDSSNNGAGSRGAEDTRDWDVIIDDPVVVRNGSDVGITTAGWAVVII